MLSKVTSKAYKLTIPDSTGVVHSLKLLNFITSAKSYKLDRQVIADIDTTLKPGDILNFPSFKLLVSLQEADYYKGSLIRYTFDCIETNNTASIYRTTVAKNSQGGVTGKSDELVTVAPCKTTLSDATLVKAIDERIERYILLLSSATDVQKHDRIEFSNGLYKPAKVESLIQLTPGIYEIHFDIDPR